MWLKTGCTRNLHAASKEEREEAEVAEVQQRNLTHFPRELLGKTRENLISNTYKTTQLAL